MFNMSNHQENASRGHSETSPHTHWDRYFEQDKGERVLGCGEKGRVHQGCECEWESHPGSNANQSYHVAQQPHFHACTQRERNHHLCARACVGMCVLWARARVRVCTSVHVRAPVCMCEHACARACARAFFWILCEMLQGKRNRACRGLQCAERPAGGASARIQLKRDLDIKKTEQSHTVIE
jgi:hypothetical protein